MGVNSEEVRGNELLRIIDSITNPRDPRGFVSFDDLKVTDEHGVSAIQLGYTTKDLVAPADLTKIDDTHISWNGVTGQALYLQKWAGSVRSDMISSLAELPINQVITLDMTSWEQSRAIETIESMNTDLKVQKSDYVLKHSQTMYITDEMLPTNLQDAMENARDLRDDLVSRDQKMWSLTCTTMTWADSLEDCDENSGAIQDVFRRFTCRAVPLVKLQRQGFAAMLPTGRCDIPYVRNLTTALLAALVPFTSVELMERGGMWMGQNQTSKNFIFYNRRDAVAPNGFILGKPGRGKSVTAKNTILWTLLTDPTAEVIVLDPEREYINVAREMDGEVVQISGDSHTYINPFDLELVEGEQPLAMKVDAIMSMVEMMAKNLSPMQKTLVDRCVSRIYDRYFATHDQRDIPTLIDFYNMLNQQPEPEGRMLRRHHRALRHRPGLAVQPPDQREHAQALRRLRHPRLRRQHEGPGAADPARPDVEPHRAQPRAPRPHLGVHRRDAAALRERLRDLVLRPALDPLAQVRRHPDRHHAEHRAHHQQREEPPDAG